MADPTTAGGGTARLRDDLARIIDPKALEIMGRSVVARHERWAVLAESIAYRKADEIIAGPLADFLARASAEQARVEAERDRWTRRAEAAEAESALLKKHIGALRDALDRSEARYAEAQNGPNG